MPKGRPEVPDGTWPWFQGFTPRSNRRFRPQVDVLIGEPFAVPPGRERAALVAATDDMRNRLVALIAELDQIRGLGVLRALRPKGA